MKITIRYLDCCRSDYFQGWDTEKGPCVAIPVGGETKIGDLAECLMEEIGDQEEIPEQITAEMIAEAVTTLFSDSEADTIAFPGIPIGEESDSYAYFGVILELD